MLAVLQPSLPGLGLVDMSPASSTATHSEALAHETPVSGLPSSIGTAGDQADAPEPLPTSASPRSSTAMQGPLATHETASNSLPSSLATTLHDGCEAVGLGVLRTLP